MTYKHRWVDSEDADARLPVTYYQVCSKCGANQEDGNGRVIVDATCVVPDPIPWWKRWFK